MGDIGLDADAMVFYLDQTMIDDDHDRTAVGIFAGIALRDSSRQYAGAPHRQAR